MGNCQAVDDAAIAIQYPTGRVDKLYCPIPAGEIMRLNPGNYVALLLTTTLYSSTAAAPAAVASAANNANAPLRITRIKILRPSDTLAVGHVYRLVPSQEVMKGLLAKKQKNGKTTMTDKQTSASYVEMKTNNNQTREERNSSRRSGAAGHGNGIKGGRTWQPALNSISESLP